jgi:hypothetical protein
MQIFFHLTVTAHALSFHMKEKAGRDKRLTIAILPESCLIPSPNALNTRSGKYLLSFFLIHLLL